LDLPKRRKREKNKREGKAKKGEDNGPLGVGSELLTLRPSIGLIVAAIAHKLSEPDRISVGCECESAMEL
jgi:hypothetical protein